MENKYCVDCIHLLNKNNSYLCQNTGVISLVSGDKEERESCWRERYCGDCGAEGKNFKPIIKEDENEGNNLSVKKTCDFSRDLASLIKEYFDTSHYDTSLVIYKDGCVNEFRFDSEHYLESTAYTK